MKPYWCRLTAIWAILLTASSICVAQVPADSTSPTIRGRVHSTSGPISGADVLVTPLGSRETWHGSSNGNGNFVVHTPPSPGGYLLVINAAGYSSMRLRIIASDAGTSVDAALELAPAAALKPVEVKVQRLRPMRDDGIGLDYAGDGRSSPIGRTSGLSGEVSGNLNALVATIPGVNLTRNAAGQPNGFSVLGLDPNQNNAVLNGAVITARDLPRDAAVSTQVATAIYDAARGGFSGGQLAIRARPGSAFASRSIRVTLDAPLLQAGDPIASALGEQFTDMQASGVASGPALGGRILYNAALQVGHQKNRVPSFTSDRALASLGIPAETAQNFLDAVSAVGIPIQQRSIETGDNASAILRIDRTASSTTNINLVATGRLRETRGLDASPFAIAGYGQTTRSIGGTLVGSLSSYLHKVVLNDVRVATSWSDDRSQSNLQLPAAMIAVPVGARDSATQPTDAPGNITLQAGGDGNLPAGTRLWRGQITDELAWQTVDNRHRLKLTVEGRFESLMFDVRGQSLGMYAFNSIDDLRNGRPAYFERTLPGTASPIHAGIGALSIGDVFHVSERVTAQYGARIDAGNYRTSSLAPPDLSVLGIVNRTQFGFIGMSPRVGLNLQYGRASNIEGMGSGPKGTVTIGLGAFRDVPTSDVLAPIVLGGSVLGAFDLICSGAATPQPDWSAFRSSTSNISDRCRAGFPSLSASGATATSLAMRFAPPVSWRANVGWDSFIDSRWRVSLNGVYSLTSSVPSLADLNFAGIPTFTLSAERDRPVFVPTASIDARTGSANPSAARVTNTLGSVTQLRSDLRARAAQLIATIAPNSPIGMLDGSLNYTYTLARTQQRGLSGSTAGSPNDVTWATPANSSRHQFNVIGSIWMAHSVTLDLWARFVSGTPFTPYVNKDINGDGFANDRAYIPDPTKNAPLDASLAAPFEVLLHTAPSYAAQCLRHSLGHIIGPATCRGPWTMLLNSQLSFRSGFFRTDRLAIDISLINIPAAADLLLHGNNVHGWGQSGFVDPVLLQVTGFDAASRAYHYAVNPSFGRSLSAKTGLRAPFRVMIGAHIAIGPSRNEQVIGAVAKLQPTPTAPDSIRTAAAVTTLDHLEATFPDVVQAVIAAKDSIRLTATQVDSLWALDRQFVAASDSIWTPMAEYLSRSHMSGYSVSGAMMRLRLTQKQAGHLAERMAVRIKAVLTSQQLAQFPPLFAVLLDERRVGDLVTQSYF